ncbi:hypothetical protein ACET3Z_013446 [Daucus carota]
MDVKEVINKAGKTVLYLELEYMNTDLKKFIGSFRQTGENIHCPLLRAMMIQDDDAKKPEDWDDEEDGEWTPPTVPNPGLEGPWTPKVFSYI